MHVLAFDVVYGALVVTLTCYGANYKLSYYYYYYYYYHS